MKKKFVFAFFIFLMISFFSIQTIHAGGGGLTGGSTEITQLMNNIELGIINGTGLQQLARQLQQLANEAIMIQHQVTNLKRLTSSPTQLINTINLLANVINQGQIISYAASNVDSQFANLHPGYTSYTGLGGINSAYIRNKLIGWNNQSKDSILSVLKASRLQESTMLNEQSRIATIKVMSESAVGNMQVTQATNLIASEQAGSLQRLRMLVMDQSQLHANTGFIKK